MEKEKFEFAFINYLEGLQEDRAALAALRRGLGKPAGSAPEMYPYVVPWIPGENEGWRERNYYLIASLYALHPQSAQSGNMGDHFTLAKTRSNSSPEAVERRFTALLSAHPEDLGIYLRHAISFLSSTETPVQWHQLMYDIEHWSHPKHYIQRSWANAYWRKRISNETKTSDKE